jgi:hypothetical protein
MSIRNTTVNFVHDNFYVGRPEETSKKYLLLLWTKASMMLDWGSSTFDITTAGIVGISHCWYGFGCWCWQCLLTVGENVLAHIVTPLDITTVAWCCRQTQYVLRPAECPPAALQTSQWQWTARAFNNWHCTWWYSSVFAEVCLKHYLTL